MMIPSTTQNFNSDSSAKRTLALLTVALLLAGGWLSGCHQTQPDEIPAAAQVSSPEGGEAEKEDNKPVLVHADEPEDARVSDAKKRFSIPIPQGWRAKVLDEDWVQMIGPDAELDVIVGVVLDNAAEEAIARGWTKWGHDFSDGTKTVSNPPASEGLEEVVVVTYQMEERKQFAQALARQYKGDTYVVAVSGDLAAIQKRASQLATMMTGLQISALETTDLSEAEPAAFDAAMQAQFDAYIQQQFDRSGIPG